jgi:hypothetical protein
MSDVAGDEESEVPVDPTVLNAPLPGSSADVTVPFELDEHTLRSLQQFLESQQLNANASEQVREIKYLIDLKNPSSEGTSKNLSLVAAAQQYLPTRVERKDETPEEQAARLDRVRKENRDRKKRWRQENADRSTCRSPSYD